LLYYESMDKYKEISVEKFDKVLSAFEDNERRQACSNYKLTALLNGEGLTLEKFVELIKQELFSRAECKAKLLKDIREATGTKAWRVSLTLLEKLYPEEYGPKGGGIEDRLARVEENAWVVNIVNKSLPAKKEEVDEDED